METVSASLRGFDTDDMSDLITMLSVLRKNLTAGEWQELVRDLTLVAYGHAQKNQETMQFLGKIG